MESFFNALSTSTAAKRQHTPRLPPISVMAPLLACHVSLFTRQFLDQVVDTAKLLRAYIVLGDTSPVASQRPRSVVISE